MERRIIYVINPISGTRTKKDLQEYIERTTAAKKIPYQVFPSVASGDYSFLHSIIKEKKITDVVVAGGDGTVSQVVGGLLDFNLNFGVIPCGSGNGLALTAGISKKPETALEVIFNGKPSIVDGLMINDNFSCMLCGLGFDAKVAHEFAKQPRRGLGTYASVVRKNFFSAPSYRFELSSNGIRFNTDAFFISIANSNQFGNNFTIAPKALLSDGLLDIVIVKKMAKPLLLLTIMKQVLAGRINQVENSLQQPVIYFQTKELEIKNTDMAPLHIDGDPAETPEYLKIKVLKKCFRLISPA
jgi:YegS/Rv2252/BmrU family lipid kinase